MLSQQKVNGGPDDVEEGGTSSKCISFESGLRYVAGFSLGVMCWTRLFKEGYYFIFGGIVIVCVYT